MFVSDIEDRWMKFGSIKELISLGDDVIAIASGIHVMFLNLSTREERIERFDSSERGRGASCLAGHSVVPMFATAERRSHPKLFIFTYPTINRIAICSLQKQPSKYLSSTFAGTDYLVTLTDFPNFQIIIWLWRTGECLTTIDTKITDHDQRIACSPSSPYMISQIGNTSGQLEVYEISVCVKIVSIAPVIDYTATCLSSKRIVSSSWMSDGNFVFCDCNGEISLMSNDGKRCLVIVRGEKDGLDSGEKSLLKSFRTGIIFVNKNSQIHFYRKPIDSNPGKFGSLWKSFWSIAAPSRPNLAIQCRNKDSLVFHCDRGEIFELTSDCDNDSPTIRVLFNMGSNYKFLTPVNPLSDHLAAIDSHERIDILQCSSGEVIANICMNAYGEVQCVTSHPNLPIIAIGTAAGKCIMLSLSIISEPLVTEIYYLQRETLNKIRYSLSGCILGVANTRLAKLFIVNDINQPDNDVPELLSFSFEIVDFLIYRTNSEMLKILLLAKTINNLECGQKIVVYSFTRDTQKHECIIELPSLLNSLDYGRNDNEIIVVPYLTKQLHFIEIQKNFMGLHTTGAFFLGHHLRNIAISVDANFIVTCSYDGLVIVRSRINVKEVLTIFMAHHRREGGTKNAIYSTVNNTFVSLGRNGDLIATKICNLEVTASIFVSSQLALVSHKSNKSITEDDVTWFEQSISMTLKKEREICAVERSSILKDFHNLRERLKLLLDTNEIQSANAKLPICDFDIDPVTRNNRIQENLLNKKNLLSQLEKKIFQQDKVSKYLRELCWDSMKVPSSFLLSISGKITVENFPMPWISKGHKNPHERKAFENTIELSSENNAKFANELSECSVIIGTTTHRWIPAKPIEFDCQLKNYTSYIENRNHCNTIREQERKLKIYFNELFTNMRTLKEHELNMAAKRINEMKHSSLELRDTFGINRSNDDDTLQPLWHYSEKPETIVTVTNDEITTCKAAIFLPRDNNRELMRERENERLKLNNKFREETLEIMMDGLLEVRWEDEMRKDCLKPQCLSSKKDPLKYTEEEIAEIKVYRIKCEDLRAERETYRKLLEDKILSLKEALTRDTDAFDRKLEIFCLSRMKIESAILQENLMRLRESQRQSMRRRGIEMIRMAQDDLELMSKEHRNLDEITINLESIVNDTRNRYDNLTKRDKLLETKFRGEFPDLKQPMVEHLLRQYRKRPRNAQFSCTSVTYLIEIARCVLNGEKSEILPRDCYQFLRAIDDLDVMPNNLPAQIDYSHWNLLCKLRRAKIELEIKMKSCAVDLAEGEQTLISHQKCCSNMEARLTQLKQSIKDLEMDHNEALDDIEVQLVLKMGQIESKLFGNSSELSNSVLVPFRIVERANNAIIEAGKKKITAMRKTVEFRRTILWQEWRHKCMIITLQDMKEELKVLQDVKVTKEIQYYLQSQFSSVGNERDTKFYEKIAEITKQRFHRMFETENKRIVKAVVNIGLCRKESKSLVKTIEKTKLTSFKTSMVAHDDTRERDAKYRKTKLKAIMQRTTLTKKVHDNYGELIALQTKLELLRLKTYPTLRLKSLTKDSKTIDKTE